MGMIEQVQIGDPRPTRPVLRYPGGKFRDRLWILAHLPPHRVYLEPFCGAASILLQKPRTYAEIINDLDNNIVNFFQVLRDPVLSLELERVARLTPFSRSEFDAAYEPADDPVERARRLLVRSWMGHSPVSTSRPSRTGLRRDVTRRGTTPAHDWSTYPDRIKSFTDRLQGVAIECRPAVEVITYYDAPDVLIYCDPPYVPSSRTGGQCYRHEMTVKQHRELGDSLNQVKSMVVLSGYPSTLYDEELYVDWYRLELPVLTEGRTERTEVLWMNEAAYRAAQGRRAPLFELEAQMSAVCSSTG